MGKQKFVLVDKKSIFIDERVKIGENVIIYENNRIDGNSEIGDNVTIYPNSFIVNSIIGKGSKIYTSVIENCKIGERNIVKPFSYIKRITTEDGYIIDAFTERKKMKEKTEKLKI